MSVSLTAVVHGDSGSGKSWLGDSAPGPRLVLDVEGGTRWTRSRKVAWDPRGPVPGGVDEDTSVVVKITSFEPVGLIYQWLASGEHPFRSVVFDSLTELQKRCLDAISGSNAPDQQAWGEALRKMEGLVRAFRDLAGDKVQVVLFLAPTHLKDDKWRPLLQGQLGSTLPYYVDVLGYLYPEPTGEEFANRLLVRPVGNFTAKDRTDILSRHFGPSIPNPTMSEILRVLEEATNA